MAAIANAALRLVDDGYLTRFTAAFIENAESSAIASATNLTERSRSSRGYFFGAGMTSPFGGIRPSTEPGANQFRSVVVADVLALYSSGHILGAAGVSGQLEIHARAVACSI